MLDAFYKTTQNNGNSVFALKEHFNNFCKWVLESLKNSNERIDWHTPATLVRMNSETLQGTRVLLRKIKPAENSGQQRGSELTRTVSSRAWILGSVRTSSSRRTFDSETETFRRCGCCCGDILWVSARQKRATHPKQNKPKPK